MAEIVTGFAPLPAAYKTLGKFEQKCRKVINIVFGKMGLAIRPLTYSSNLFYLDLPLDKIELEFYPTVDFDRNVLLVRGHKYTAIGGKGDFNYCHRKTPMSAVALKKVISGKYGISTHRFSYSKEKEVGLLVSNRDVHHYYLQVTLTETCPPPSAS